ncbi:hypothetical protein ABK040_015578 [Willaertia magna]
MISAINNSHINNKQEENIALFKYRQQLKELMKAKGNGTSVITLFISPKTALIFNRQSVLTALKSALHRLKLFTKTPSNGLAVFSGMINSDLINFKDGFDDGDSLVGDDNNGNVSNQTLKKLCLVIEPPFHPIEHNLYYCDDRFHVDQLLNQLHDYECGKVFGFIIVNGQSCLFATLKGNHSKILHEFSVDLPKKHSKGGQSRERFARNREIARDAYLKEVAEKANHYFISQSQNCALVDGIILAGSADLKNELLTCQSDTLDYRLRNKVISTIDICYGGKMGLYQAIELCKDLLKDAKYVEEQQVINELFTALHKGNNRSVVGLDEVMYAVNHGWVDKLILCEAATNLKRVTLMNDKEIRYMTDEQLKEEMKYLNIVRIESVIDYLIENYHTIGVSTLELVSNATNEGQMFLNGFSGIGGILKFEVDVTSLLSQDKEACVNLSTEEGNQFEEEDEFM